MARAQKKAERMQVLRRLYEEKRNEQIRKYMVVYVVLTLHYFFLFLKIFYRIKGN